MNYESERLVRDLELIAEHLHNLAERYDMCDDYDTEIAKVNKLLSHPWLKVRSNDWEFEIRVKVTVDSKLDYSDTEQQIRDAIYSAQHDVEDDVTIEDWDVN